MPRSRTEILSPDPAGLSRAADLLNDGRLVAFPTETVYGLGADARNPDAVARVYSAKNRPRSNPLIVHVANALDALALVRFDPVAERLAETFWPGPLTLVLPFRQNPVLSKSFAAGLPTIAIRVPDHDIAAGLLTECGHPVVAPSANRSGKISPTSSADVLEELDSRIDAVIDGGPTAFGLESTVVRTSSNGRAIELLRPGAIPRETIERLVEIRVGRHSPSDLLLSPGQLKSHYAPAVRLRMNVDAPEANELFLGFGDTYGRERDNLSRSGDLEEAASRLFSMLRRLDAEAQSCGKSIAVAPVPSHGIGAAINDRLERASRA